MHLQVAKADLKDCRILEYPTSTGDVVRVSFPNHQKVYFNPAGQSLWVDSRSGAEYIKPVLIQHSIPFKES